ncbi:hypothetical protein X743_18730 [Mesorhizobium sp. LNHC252B00]|nr:hypothetical protein X743_18730 [Mesorhizobium sp. LNHC252B00]
MVVETDSIPRIKIRDIMSAVQFTNRAQATSLEALRVKVNTDRRESSAGTRGYSIARDVASELAKLGLADVGPLPKDAKGFEKKRDMKIRITEAGEELARVIKHDRAQAYSHVLKSMFEVHPYVRRFLLAASKGALLAPVVTSAKQHISPKYISAKTLAEDVAQGRFDLDGLLRTTTDRLERTLSAEEVAEIEAGMQELVSRLMTAAAAEPQSDFARKMLMAINEVVVPAVLRRAGLGFDYNTLRRLSQMGREFQVSWGTSAHPRHDGWLIFATASLAFSDDEQRLAEVRFDNGVRRMAHGFLDRLYETYSLTQEWGLGTVITAWEMRATFCFQNRCAPGVFDHLFSENYGGSETYRIDKDFPPRNKPTHEEPLVIGGREIGLIRISKR